VEVRLRRIDQRYTPGRRAMVDLLTSLGHPVSISDIAAQLPEVPRSSAYRHLVDLQSAGVVRRIAASDEFARFELAEDLTEHHHHLLCSSCGRVTDVTPTQAFERMVAKMVHELAAQQDFHPTSHALDVIGYCSECTQP
jgi:Fe2+ or Zn2+ uptake regulation protein